ncbi:hypothetical protein [Paenibacillus ginsengarvi]|uniref:Uncharacterized protein n=1 Tax=Paenibacillus ginsengarvi TaxID=400777 RepID=A0A3B0BSS2_9BACL|nr:hypothetical protein [Paenibacillus ginsengarvi]RKN75972.1 hypothetical protein D7M11_24530 [Paenibacillus ginsengarvi]
MHLRQPHTSRIPTDMTRSADSDFGKRRQTLTFNGAAEFASGIMSKYGVAHGDYLGRISLIFKQQRELVRQVMGGSGSRSGTPGERLILMQQAKQAAADDTRAKQPVKPALTAADSRSVGPATGSVSFVNRVIRERAEPAVVTPNVSIAKLSFPGQNAVPSPRFEYDAPRPPYGVLSVATSQLGGLPASVTSNKSATADARGSRGPEGIGASRPFIPGQKDRDPAAERQHDRFTRYTEEKAGVIRQQDVQSFFTVNRSLWFPALAPDTASFSDKRAARQISTTGLNQTHDVPVVLRASRAAAERERLRYPIRMNRIDTQLPIKLVDLRYNRQRSEQETLPLRNASVTQGDSRTRTVFRTMDTEQHEARSGRYVAREKPVNNENDEGSVAPFGRRAGRPGAVFATEGDTSRHGRTETIRLPYTYFTHLAPWINAQEHSMTETKSRLTLPIAKIAARVEYIHSADPIALIRRSLYSTQHSQINPVFLSGRKVGSAATDSLASSAGRQLARRDAEAASMDSILANQVLSPFRQSGRFPAAFGGQRALAMPAEQHVRAEEGAIYRSSGVIRLPAVNRPVLQTVRNSASSDPILRKPFLSGSSMTGLVFRSHLAVPASFQQVASESLGVGDRRFLTSTRVSPEGRREGEQRAPNPDFAAGADAIVATTASAGTGAGAAGGTAEAKRTALPNPRFHGDRMLPGPVRDFAAWLREFPAKRSSGMTRTESIRRLASAKDDGTRETPVARLIRQAPGASPTRAIPAAVVLRKVSKEGRPVASPSTTLSAHTLAAQPAFDDWLFRKSRLEPIERSEVLPRLPGTAISDARSLLRKLGMSGRGAVTGSGKPDRSTSGARSTTDQTLRRSPNEADVPDRMQARSQLPAESLPADTRTAYAASRFSLGKDVLRKGKRLPLLARAETNALFRPYRGDSWPGAQRVVRRSTTTLPEPGPLFTAEARRLVRMVAEVNRQQLASRTEMQTEDRRVIVQRRTAALEQPKPLYVSEEARRLVRLITEASLSPLSARAEQQPRGQRVVVQRRATLQEQPKPLYTTEETRRLVRLITEANRSPLLARTERQPETQRVVQRRATTQEQPKPLYASQEMKQFIRSVTETSRPPLSARIEQQPETQRVVQRLTTATEPAPLGTASIGRLTRIIPETFRTNSQREKLDVRINPQWPMVPPEAAHSRSGRNEAPAERTYRTGTILSGTRSNSPAAGSTDMNSDRFEPGLFRRTASLRSSLRGFPSNEKPAAGLAESPLASIQRRLSGPIQRENAFAPVSVQWPTDTPVRRRFDSVNRLHEGPVKGDAPSRDIGGFQTAASSILRRHTPARTVIVTDMNGPAQPPQVSGELAARRGILPKAAEPGIRTARTLLQTVQEFIWQQMQTRRRTDGRQPVAGAGLPERVAVKPSVPVAGAGRFPPPFAWRRTPYSPAGEEAAMLQRIVSQPVRSAFPGQTAGRAAVPAISFGGRGTDAGSLRTLRRQVIPSEAWTAAASAAGRRIAAITGAPASHSAVKLPGEVQRRLASGALEQHLWRSHTNLHHAGMQVSRSFETVVKPIWQRAVGETTTLALYAGSRRIAAGAGTAGDSAASGFSPNRPHSLSGPSMVRANGQADTIRRRMSAASTVMPSPVAPRTAVSPSLASANDVAFQRSFARRSASNDTIGGVSRASLTLVDSGRAISTIGGQTGVQHSANVSSPLLEHKLGFESPSGVHVMEPADLDYRRSYMPRPTANAAVEQAPRDSKADMEELLKMVKKLPQFDIKKLAERVYREIERKMRFDRQTRGF